MADGDDEVVVVVVVVAVAVVVVVVVVSDDDGERASCPPSHSGEQKGSRSCQSVLIFSHHAADDEWVLITSLLFVENG